MPEKVTKHRHRIWPGESSVQWKLSPPTPGSLKALLLPPLFKQSRKQGNARGMSEVRRGTSSIHLHCPVPRSSSHIGHGKDTPKVYFFTFSGILGDIFADPLLKCLRPF